LKREVEWKKLSGDVFRKPSCPLLLSVLLGAGVHILFCFYTALMTTIVSLVSPLNLPLQVSLLTAVFPFFSGVNGYVAARMYKFFNGTYWILLAIISSCALPLFLASTLFVIDICEYIETNRASIVPVSDIFVLFVLWLSLNVPMTLLGAFIGFRSPVIWTPGKLNRVAR